VLAEASSTGEAKTLLLDDERVLLNLLLKTDVVRGK